VNPYVLCFLFGLFPFAVHFGLRRFSRKKTPLVPVRVVAGKRHGPFGMLLTVEWSDGATAQYTGAANVWHIYPSGHSCSSWLGRWLKERITEKDYREFDVRRGAL
jgi:hypothetical protein